jgi:hypothetical protein
VPVVAEAAVEPAERVLRPVGLAERGRERLDHAVAEEHQRRVATLRRHVAVRHEDLDAEHVVVPGLELVQLAGHVDDVEELADGHLACSFRGRGMPGMPGVSRPLVGGTLRRPSAMSLL